jgi:RNA polymerase sigma-70 factor (ECF subfamily)
MPDTHVPEPYFDADTAGLVRDARRGSQAAYSSLYRRFVGLVHGILVSRIRPALADELTQECFAKAFRQLSQLKDDGKFGAWIAMIARRLAADTVDALADAEVDHGTAASLPDESTEASRVLRALMQLPDAYRETLAMRLIEGMSGAEIASKTGLKPESVRVNLHRGLEKLRAALDIRPSENSP